MITRKYSIREYLTDDDVNPFREWLGLLPVATRSRVQARILRAEYGNLGNFKSVGHGVCEMVLDFGPGYRIYFGFERDRVILVLGGGNKSSQRKDIIRARQSWIDYRNRGSDGTPKR